MKGKVLINRNYRGDVENSMIDKFIGYVNLLFVEQFRLFTVNMNILIFTPPTRRNASNLANFMLKVGI